MREKVRRVFKLLGIYAVLYFIATAFFIGMFHTSLFGNVKVLMYRGIIFLIICGMMAALFMAWIKYIWAYELISVKDIVLMFCGFCCVNMVLFTLIPVTVERSVSVFMLSYMDENSDKEFAKEEMEEIFNEIYVKEYGAFEKRFYEQLVTGSICEREDGVYVISERGKMIVRMFRLAAAWFNTDRRLVYPGAGL